MEITAKGENNIPHNGGLGTGGKFRKQPHRRYHTKPYDRPAARVSYSFDRNNGGWISTLMDPVQRIITHIAHSLFALIPRKLVTPDESNLQPLEQRPHLPGTDVKPEAGLRDTEATITDQINMRNENRSTTSQIGSIDSSIKNQEQSNKLISRFPTSHETNLVSAAPPLGSQKSLHECIASPAELAKAYMGSKTSQVSRGLRGQVAKEDSVFLNKSPCPPKPSTISLFPRSSMQSCLPKNGLVTPKSRGRSSANTIKATKPYSRPHESALKGASSQSTWEESLPSGSRLGAHKGLKRTSSILDSDIGSLVPVRRIRQRSNLSSRNLPLPASDSPLSVRGSGVGLDFRDASSCKFPHTARRRREDKAANTSVRSTEDKPGSSFKLVPSKSAEIGSKISQLIDKMVPINEKPPTKLSSSKLHCPASNSLPNVKAQKLWDNVQQTRAASPDSSYQKQGKPKENGSREV